MTAVRVMGTPRMAADVLTRLVAEISLLPSLAEVAAWAETWNPPATAIEAIEQDEFAHDIVLRLDDATHVVFAAT